MNTENTSIIASKNLAEAEAAITEFDRVQAGIADLKTKYVGVVFPVGTTAGMKDAIAARAAVREPRIATEKARKAGKAPLLALGKILDEKAKWITAELVAIEDPIDEQIKAEEARREAERLAAVKAEEDRIAGHRAGIEAIRATLVKASGQSCEELACTIADLSQRDVSEAVFQEFAPAAHKARAETVEALQELLQAAIERAAEAKRLAEERAELARLRAEQEAREAAERERIAAEQKAQAERLAAERAAFERQQEAARAEQQRLAAEAEAARKAADEKAAKERAEADRLDRERRDAEQAKLDAQAAEIRRQQEAIDAENRRKEAERAAEEARQQQEAARVKAEADAKAAEALRTQQEAASAARQKTDALRTQIDALLDAMNDDELSGVLAYLRKFAVQAAA